MKAGKEKRTKNRASRFDKLANMRGDYGYTATKGNFKSQKLEMMSMRKMDRADIMAIVSLVGGVLALIGYFYGTILFGIAAIVTGVLALKWGTSRRGMALAGIILGAFAILFWLLLFIVIFSVWF